MIEIREFLPEDYGGAIIGDGKGKIVLELIKGSRSRIARSDNREIKIGAMDVPNGILRFQYEANVDNHEKAIMLNALKYLIPDLNRSQLQELKVYAEFIYHPDYGYKFIDISDHDFWTNLDSKSLSPKAGD